MAASKLTFTETTEVSFPTFVYSFDPFFKKKYSHSENDWNNKPIREWNTDSRNNEIKRHLRIEEVPLVDILNELNKQGLL